MKDKFFERRVKMARMYVSGVPPAAIVEQLSTEYKVSKNILWRDWGSRREWMSGIALQDIKQTQEAITDLLLQSQESRRLALVLYHSTNNDSVKLGCIRNLGELIAKEIELRQSLNLLPREPLQIEATGMGNQTLVLQMYMPEVEIERQRKLGRTVIETEGKCLDAGDTKVDTPVQIRATPNPEAVPPG